MATRNQKDKITMEVVKISPKMAADWLEFHNPINRKLTASTVGLYARLIGADKWALNGEAIMFDTNGDLINGQHRLAAIIEADRSVEMFVGTGFPPEYRDTMDQHRKRSAGDILGMHGIVDGVHVAAIARVCHRWDAGIRGASLLGAGQTMLTPTEILEYLEKEPLVIDAATSARSGDAQQLAPTRAWGFLYVVTHRANEGQAEEFFARLMSGELLESGNPILTLRRYWGNLENKRSTGFRRTRTRTNTFNYMNSGVRAWNAWANGETLKTITWKTHNIPEVEKPPTLPARKSLPARKK